MGGDIISPKRDHGAKEKNSISTPVTRKILLRYSLILQALSQIVFLIGGISFYSSCSFLSLFFFGLIVSVRKETVR